MPTETAIDKEQSLRTELVAVEQQSAIVITSQETYDQASAAFLAVKSWRKSWEKYWYGDESNPGPITLANRSWKSLLGKFGERDDPAKKLEKELGSKILSWDDQQRRLQEQRQREAQEKAEADEAARRAQLAFEMEESGADEAEIEQVVSAPIVAVAPPVQTYQKASGVSTRDNWCIEIVDLKKLLRLIVSGKLKIPAEDATKLTDVLESILKPRAVSDKETLNLDGCRAVNRKIVAGRTR